MWPASSTMVSNPEADDWTPRVTTSSITNPYANSFSTLQSYSRAHSSETGSLNNGLSQMKSEPHEPGQSLSQLRLRTSSGIDLDAVSRMDRAIYPYAALCWFARKKRRQSWE